MQGPGTARFNLFSYGAAREAAAGWSFVRDQQRYHRVAKWQNARIGQTVMVLPVPRVATTEFWQAWVKQPYTKDNTILLFYDAQATTPLAFANAWIKDTPGYEANLSTQLLKPAETGITHEEFERKMVTAIPPLWSMFLPSVVRDAKYHPWIGRHMKKHLPADKDPGQERRDVVILAVPAQVHAVIAHLEARGFAVADETEVAVGDDATISRLEDIGVKGESVVYLYIYFMFFAVLAQTIVDLRADYVKFRDERYAQLEAEQAAAAPEEKRE